jgi:hypothetical protein
MDDLTDFLENGLYGEGHVTYRPDDPVFVTAAR